MKISKPVRDLADKYIIAQNARLGELAPSPIIPAAPVTAKRKRTPRTAIATGRARANRAIAAFVTK